MNDVARIIWVAGLLLSANGPVLAQQSTPIPCPLEPGPTRAVSAIIDGDTIRLDDGIEVRLAGILAPRPRDAGLAASAGTWPPAMEAREGLQALVGGRSVALAFTRDRNDRYHRVIAHLFTDVGRQQTWVQGHLVEHGLVRAAPRPGGDNPCHTALVALERRARNANRGLWSNAAYQIRPADRPGELARYRYTFQLVRGRIEHVRMTSRLAIAEFASGEHASLPDGRPQRFAFHVIWRRTAATELKLPGARALSGRNILVRGWVDLHRGPEMELVAPGQIEFED